MKIMNLLLGNVILCSIIIILQLTALNVPNWIEQGSESRYWTGSLLSKSNVFYTNISCNKLETSFCTGFMNLWKSGLIFFSFELLSILMSLVLLFYLFKLLLKLETNYIYLIFSSIGASISHLLGLCLWSGLVNLKFGRNKCLIDYMNSSNASVCGKEGPILGIFIVFLDLFQVLYAWLTIVYIKKTNEKITEKNNVEEAKIISKAEI